MANEYAFILTNAAANGAGPWVDVSAMGAEKTIVIGGDPRATINIEISNETGAPTQAGATVASFLCFGAGSAQTVKCAAMWMRAVVSDYKSGLGHVSVGANDDGCDAANLPASAGDGVGASVDVSALGGNLKTVVVSGAYRGSVIVEISEDNTLWAQAMVFTNSPRLQSKLITAQFMRVRRGGVPTISPGLPQVDVGVVPDVTPSPAFSDPELIRVVADGTEGSSKAVAFGSPRPTATYYVAYMRQFEVAASGIAKSVVSIELATQTVNGFTVNFSAPLEAGDSFEFLVVGN